MNVRSDFNKFSRLNNLSFLNSYRYGIYPLTAFGAKRPPLSRPRAISPETAESVKSVTPEPIDVESRKVVNMMCSVKPRDDGAELLVSLWIETVWKSLSMFGGWIHHDLNTLRD